MKLHPLTAVSALLLLCLLTRANGNVKRKAILQPAKDNGADGRLLGSLTRLPILTTTSNPFDEINLCAQREQQAVALTRTSLPRSIAPFFIGVNFPPSARVGEIFNVKIAALNILSSSLPIRVSLVSSTAYDIIGPSALSVCLPPNGQIESTISVQPLEAGPAIIIATAAVDSAPSCGPSVSAIPYEIRSPIRIEFPGIPKQITFSKFMCNGEDYEEEDWLAEWRLEIPDGSVIPGSVKAWVSVTGDLLGPTLDNIGDLIRMPNGCGEQNMITMTPNIYVLQYLEATNQLTSDVRARLIDNMNAGYMRELNYKRSDGSYSAFGYRDESGSTWLTAFVVKSYAQAKNYIAVDPNEIAQSSAWLKNLQQADGCFQSVGRVIHKGMQGGNEDGAPGALAAFVMVALLEAGEAPSSSAITKAKACVDAATAFGTPGDSNYYLLAMKAYAHSLAGYPTASATIGILFSGMRLADPPSLGNYWPINNPNSGSINAALSIETTSYSLLAILTEYGHVLHYTSAQIVKWLSSKMNCYGGFVSTQDTVLALQALAFFERLHPQPTLGVDVTVVGVSLNAFFQITESNNLVNHMADVDVIPNDVKVEVEGNGCALVQAVVSYSVENPQGGNGMVLDINPVDKRILSCGYAAFSICVGYTLRDGASNMAIIEITLVTGYVPVQNDLESLVCGGQGNIKMYEVEGSKIIFYIDSLTASQTCVEFRASRETVVKNAKNGTIKVYDYYEPELFVSQTFALTPAICVG